MRHLLASSRLPRRPHCCAAIAALTLACAALPARLAAQPGAVPRDIAIADLDGAGGLDLVTASYASDAIAVRFGDGSGGFAAPVTVALGAPHDGPVAVAAGDLDGDSTADDVAVACLDSATVALVLDAASPSPSVQTVALTGKQPRAVAVADLDGAAGDEVVVAREGDGSGGEGLDLIAGGVRSEIAIPAGRARRAVDLQLRLLDADSQPDLVVVARGSPDEALLYQGVAPPTPGFTAAGFLALPTSGSAAALCCEDLDGDGDNDLAAVVPSAAANQLQVFRFTGGGSLDPSDFSATSPALVGGAGAVAAAGGDLDGDGAGEVVVVNGTSQNVVVRNNFSGATGAFASTSLAAAGAAPSAVALGDLDGDGRLDIAVANAGSGDVSVTRSPLALAEVLGSGCYGQNGKVPSMRPVGWPVLGGAQFAVSVTNARQYSAAMMLFGVRQQTTPVTGICSVYIGFPIGVATTVTDGAGSAAVQLPVAPSASLLGLSVYFQWAIVDSRGAYASLFSFSSYLRARVGH